MMYPREESEPKRSLRGEQVLSYLSEKLARESSILSARVYGSFLGGETTVDLDLAMMVPSVYGVIGAETYRVLREIRFLSVGN